MESNKKSESNDGNTNLHKNCQSIIHEQTENSKDKYKFMNH